MILDWLEKQQRTSITSAACKVSNFIVHFWELPYVAFYTIFRIYFVNTAGQFIKNNPEILVKHLIASLWYNLLFYFYELKKKTLKWYQEEVILTYFTVLYSTIHLDTLLHTWRTSRTFLEKCENSKIACWQRITTAIFSGIGCLLI